MAPRVGGGGAAPTRREKTGFRPPTVLVLRRVYTSHSPKSLNPQMEKGLDEQLQPTSQWGASLPPLLCSPASKRSIWKGAEKPWPPQGRL